MNILRGRKRDVTSADDGSPAGPILAELTWRFGLSSPLMMAFGTKPFFKHVLHRGDSL